MNLFVSCVVLSLFMFSCTKQEGDKEKIVELTIYPETGYGASVLSDVWSEPLLFSDSDDTQKQMLVDIIVEGFDFDYERGNEYTYKVKKIWMQNPPQDVSSIKYEFIDLLSKKKVITNDSEKEFKLFVSAGTVKFTPNYPRELVEVEGVEKAKIYDAMLANEMGTNNWMALTEIEGFQYEEGNEYILQVKKVTTAEPYSIRYILLEVLSKTNK